MRIEDECDRRAAEVSVLFNEPKLLKYTARLTISYCCRPVSVLFNEPKLLKSIGKVTCASKRASFSALQRAEIAEIGYVIWIT